MVRKIIFFVLYFLVNVNYCQQYQFTEKLFNKNFVFTESKQKILIKFDNTSQNIFYEIQILKNAGLILKTEEIDKIRVGIFESQQGTGAISELGKLDKNNLHIESFLPVYIDQEGFERYIDPDWITVQFNSDISSSQAEKLIESNGSSIILKHWTHGYYTISVPIGYSVFGAVKKFIQLSEVKFAEPVYYGFNDLLTDTYLNDEWHLKNTGQVQGYTVGDDINAFNAWNFLFGDPNVVLVIIDTGIDLGHPDLQGNIANRGNDDWDFSSAGYLPTDVDGHGTACAGIAAGIMNSEGIRGVAPNCKIMPLKINANAGMNQNRADAINYAVSKSSSFSRMVMSCSWGASGDITAIHSAMVNAVTNDIPIFFAAGNNNGSVGYPAKYTEAIAVGAMAPCGSLRKSPSTCDGETWWGSNYGPELDIAAPGVKIYTTDIQGNGGYNMSATPGDLSNKDYTKLFNGTSSATPMVAGVAALILSYKSNLTLTELRNILFSTADKVGGYNYNWNQSDPGHSKEQAMGELTLIVL